MCAVRVLCAQGYYRLGSTYFALGHVADAADAFLLGLQVSPGNPNLRRALAVAQEENRKALAVGSDVGAVPVDTVSTL